MTESPEALVRAVMRRYGSPFASQAGIRLRDGMPAPLFQMLCGALLFSAPIGSRSALRALKALRSAGLTTPRKMAAASWQARVDTITDTGYKRYDEKTATQLGELADKVLHDYRGDLRKLREKARRDPTRERERIVEFKGIGPVGADIFLREVQGVWPELYPYADAKVLEAARKVGLPDQPRALARLLPRERFAALTASLVQAALDHRLQELRGEARGGAPSATV